jgi:hypothetical protein
MDLTGNRIGKGSDPVGLASRRYRTSNTGLSYPDPQVLIHGQ